MHNLSDLQNHSPHQMHNSLKYLILISTPSKCLEIEIKFNHTESQIQQRF